MTSPLDAVFREGLAPLGRALDAYAAGAADAALTVHVAGFPPELLPVAYFFREGAALGAIDRAALSLARGSVLDVGAGAGAHAVPLVRAGHPVTALDVLPEAVTVLRARGVPDARLESVRSFSPPSPYDTVLALMNGASLAGTAEGLVPLLERLRGLVASGGRLLLDSTDVGDEEEDPGEGGVKNVRTADRGDAEDLGEAEPGGAQDPAEAAGEPGTLELHYQLEFEGERGQPFPQLFVSEAALRRAAREAGWWMEVVAREGERYLARMTPVDAR